MKKSALAHVPLAILALFFAFFAGLSLRHGGVAAWADAGSLQARWVVTSWRRGEGPAFSQALWRSTHDRLQDALRLTPDNGQLREDLGYLYAARALGMGPAPAGSLEQLLQRRLLEQAIDHYRAATRNRPGFAHSWAHLALAKHHRGDWDNEMWLAFDKALRFGRHEAGVQPAIAEVAFAHWDHLSTERKNSLLALTTAARPEPRRVLLDMAAAAGVSLSGPGLAP